MEPVAEFPEGRKVVADQFIEVSEAPPNNGMELTGLKHHALCKDEEQRPRRFSPAAHAKR